MEPDGSCPTCKQVIADPVASEGATAQPVTAPWHFKLLVVGLVLYLSWRAWQGIAWVLHHV